jgi:hypothetical protein
METIQFFFHLQVPNKPAALSSGFDGRQKISQKLYYILNDLRSVISRSP